MTGDTVQEKVDRVIDENDEVTDGLGDVVSRVGAVFPVRLSNEKHDARSDADQEGERDTQTHERRLTEAGRQLRRFISDFGQCVAVRGG